MAVAITADICISKNQREIFSEIRSERTKVRCDIKITRPISTGCIVFIFPSKREKRVPINRPKTIPHRIMQAKFHPAQITFEDVRFPSKMIHRTSIKRARAVPSLKILSPLKSSISLRGAPKFSNIESTATGSVADMIVPKRRQTRKGIGNPMRENRKYNHRDIREAEIRREKRESIVILFQFFKSCL